MVGEFLPLVLANITGTGIVALAVAGLIKLDTVRSRRRAAQVRAQRAASNLSPAPSGTTEPIEIEENDNG
jgi:hypothetical protein